MIPGHAAKIATESKTGPVSTSQCYCWGDVNQLGYTWFGYMLQPYHRVAVGINFHNSYLTGERI